MLIGTENVEQRNVLTSVSQGSVQLQNGRLIAPSPGSYTLVGAIFQGTTSDGQPLAVALCGVESPPEDPAMEWYQIQVWNTKSETWENPCVPTNQVPHPRALAVRGIWDGSGARKDMEGRFTFACENGAIAKCIKWGYKPWAEKGGQPLEPLHQACTRMVRADYCGNGRSHTSLGTVFDFYDDLQVQTRTLQRVSNWDPARGTFEAAWGPEGAVCLARTRDGSPVETIQRECPGNFEPGEKDLGDGDRCTVLRKDAQFTGALRNRSYDKRGLGTTLGKAADTTPQPLAAAPTAHSRRASEPVDTGATQNLCIDRWPPAPLMVEASPHWGGDVRFMSLEVRGCLSSPW
ncbi:ADYC domain-containing protein [Hyalangium sp.]|uniref:ADYC domain-containing protein n=1 Tax=Hyalangium sp. TaxID=2028555 RepID=UPI0039C89BC4